MRLGKRYWSVFRNEMHDFVVICCSAVYLVIFCALFTVPDCIIADQAAIAKYSTIFGFNFLL